MNDAIAPDALALHHALLTIDTHIDIPWPTGPDPFQDGPRCVDLPKMRRGGVSAGCFAAYVPQIQRSPTAEDAAFERATGMLRAINGMGQGGTPQGDGSQGQGPQGAGQSGNQPLARVTRTADEVEAAKRDGVLAVIPAVENGFAIGADLARIGQLRALGACYVTLTHNGHNALADSCNPRRDLGDRETEHGGLSALGRAAIAEMNRTGLMVDVAHVSRDAMLQAAETSQTPVLSTHSCVSALCDHPRNMMDWQLDVLRDVKGVIQITAVAAFLRPNAKPSQVTVSDFADHIDHAVRRIGIDHVGISSDFDGGGGFSDWRNAADSPNVTIELVRRGYDRHALQKLWGGNFLCVMRAAEAAAR